MKIKIADSFTTPGHRSREDGPHSGEFFLDTVLKPAYESSLAKNETLVVDLDGTAGYATSFLEASFGGLARIHPFLDVLKNVKIISTTEPYLVEEIELYIREARLKNSSSSPVH